MPVCEFSFSPPLSVLWLWVSDCQRWLREGKLTSRALFLRRWPTFCFCLDMKQIKLVLDFTRYPFILPVKSKYFRPLISDLIASQTPRTNIHTHIGERQICATVLIRSSDSHQQSGESSHKKNVNNSLILVPSYSDEHWICADMLKTWTNPRSIFRLL